MGQTREQRIIRQMTGKPKIQEFTPIASDMFLPNHSGISSHPEFKQKSLEITPVGIAVPYFLQVAPPSNWVYCEGQTIPIQPAFIGSNMDNGDGTMTMPHLNDLNRFVRPSQNLFTSGGSATHSHTEGTLGNAAEATHTHAKGTLANGSTGQSSSSTQCQSGTGFTANAQNHTHLGSAISGSTAAGSSHTHAISGNTADANNLPPYIDATYIMRIY
jgi:microcystin-dependent protein